MTSVRSFVGVPLSSKWRALSIEFFLQPWGEVLSVGPGTVQPSLRVGRAVYSDVAARDAAALLLTRQCLCGVFADLRIG